MKRIDKEFYSTRQDLLANLQRLELEIELQYVPMGMFRSPSPTIYFSASEIPNLGLSRYGESSGADDFLAATGSSSSDPDAAGVSCFTFFFGFSLESTFILEEQGVILFLFSFCAL